MIVSANVILFALVAAFILSALTYWKLNPERVVVSVPFVGMAIPLLLLLAVLVATAAGGIPPSWSIWCLAASLVVLAVTVRRARVLLPKAH
jgi:hypothetical protein